MNSLRLRWLNTRVTAAVVFLFHTEENTDAHLTTVYFCTTVKKLKLQKSNQCFLSVFMNSYIVLWPLVKFVMFIWVESSSTKKKSFSPSAFHMVSFKDRKVNIL